MLSPGARDAVGREDALHLLAELGDIQGRLDDLQRRRRSWPRIGSSAAPSLLATHFDAKARPTGHGAVATSSSEVAVRVHDYLCHR
jgi:hypothetical protein